jgi:hypothetical protein
MAASVGGLLIGHQAPPQERGIGSHQHNCADEECEGHPPPISWCDRPQSSRPAQTQRPRRKRPARQSPRPSPRDSNPATRMWSVLTRLTPWRSAMNPLAIRGVTGGRGAMFTSVECQSQAEEKLAQAELDERNRRRLITAAQAWIYLARQMRRVEASSTNGEVVTKRRSKSRMKAKAAT